MIERAALLVGKGVLELGCGQGMCGLVAAHFADRVMLTDYEPSVLALAALNAEAAAETCPLASAVAVWRLVWARDAALDDPGEQLGGQVFDLIIGRCAPAVSCCSITVQLATSHLLLTRRVWWQRAALPRDRPST